MIEYTAEECCVSYSKAFQDVADQYRGELSKNIDMGWDNYSKFIETLFSLELELRLLTMLCRCLSRVEVRFAALSVKVNF